MKQPTVKHEKGSQKSNKKTPVKVVYISNPMKIKASPSEFRAVVQQFTGQYATFPPSHQLPGVLKIDNNFNHQQQQEQEQIGCQDKYWQRSMDSNLCYSESQEDEAALNDLLDGYSPLLPSDFGS
ncbi:sigma factor binding protein 1, chloroplastic-like [Bidens hawaiensis]|uniref:sigma factor binding protein 1, chloroplastic-like n=1 Tax=Bidens hawaiensis TaxID=980011 RepID=UPI00404B7FFA